MKTRGSGGGLTLRMIESENQSDSCASKLGQQNEELLVAGDGNKVDNKHEAGDQIPAATTVEDVGERVCAQNNNVV